VVSSPAGRHPVTGEAADVQRQFSAGTPGNSRKITLDWVRQQMSTGAGQRAKFNAFYRKCQKADEYMLSSFNFAVPNGANMVRLGTAHSIINTLVAHVSPQFMDISVPPPGPRGQARAEKIEKFLTGAHHMLEQNTQYGRRELAKHCGLYGISWRKIEFDIQRWARFPEPPGEDEPADDYLDRLNEVEEKRGTLWPIIGEAVNPQTVVWDTNSREPRWLIHFYKLDAVEIHARFPDWEGPQSGEVDFWEVWTDTHVAYVADNRWALAPRNHGYAKLPWTMYRPQTGLRTVGSKPEHLYRGLLDSLFEMLEAQSRLGSQLLDITSKVAWSTEDWSGPPAITQEAMNDYDQSPGSRNFIPPGVERTPSDIPQTPNAIGEAIGFLESKVEEDSAPAVSRGQRPAGAASGFHTSVLAGIAALNFGAVVDAMERGLQQDNELMLRIVERVIRERITVWGKTESGSLEASLSPRDIKTHYVTIVRLNTTSPEEQERKVNLWSTQWRTGFVDKLTALRKAGVDDPLSVINARLSEDFFEDPMVKQAFAALAAQRVPILQQALESQENGPGSSGQVDALAAAVLGGSGQAPNGGSFGPGNTAGSRPGGSPGNPSLTTRPVMPGSLREQDVTARQIAGPRSGNRRIPGRDLSPGLGA
jgi:hypothetical protein